MTSNLLLLALCATLAIASTASVPTTTDEELLKVVVTGPAGSILDVLSAGKLNCTIFIIGQQYDCEHFNLKELAEYISGKSNKIVRRQADDYDSRRWASQIQDNVHVELVASIEFAAADTYFNANGFIYVILKQLPADEGNDHENDDFWPKDHFYPDYDYRNRYEPVYDYFNTRGSGYV